MIKEIFLPEKINSRRIISQRILGLSIQDNIIRASQSYLTSTTNILENLSETEILPGAESTYKERAGEASTRIMSKLSKHDKIRISIPTNIVTFKELKLPFIDREKIKMVIEYEVEPLLPFPISEAIIDFIITRKIPEENSSHVLVAAVRQEDLQKIFDSYIEGGIDPDYITIDLFSLYGLYLQIPEYKNLTNASAIVEIWDNNTIVAFLLNGELRLVRNIQKGLNTIADNIGKDASISAEEIKKSLLSLDIKELDKQLNKKAEKHLINFLNDIQFTLNSFSLKLNFDNDVSKILFVGSGSKIKGLMEFGSELLQIPCEILSCNKLFKEKILKNKLSHEPKEWIDYVIPIGTSLPYAQFEEFNLRKKSFQKTKDPIKQKQVITSIALAIFIFLGIGTSGFINVRSLNSVASQRENDLITKIKKMFPTGSPSLKKNALTTLLRDAEQQVSTKEEAWAPFLNENLQPLEILLDLTKTIDKRLFNVAIEKISIEIEELEPTAEITGIFRSSDPEGKHFEDFENFVKFFEQNSKILIMKEKPDEDLVPPQEGGGVKFTFKLKLKEPQEDNEY